MAGTIFKGLTLKEYPHYFEPKKMTKNNFCMFYIVRHGETVENVNRILQGHTNGKIPLSPLGESQAKQTAKLFASIHIDAVFSSDLTRAYRTAELITTDKQLAIITAKALRERTWGHMDGKTYDEFYKKFEEIIAQKETLTHEQRKNIKYAPDIESDDEVITRFTTFLREVAVAHVNKTILMVSHGGPLRLLLQHLGWNNGQKLKPGFMPNAGYIKLRSDGVDFFINEVNVYGKPT